MLFPYKSGYGNGCVFSQPQSEQCEIASCEFLTITDQTEACRLRTVPLMDSVLQLLTDLRTSNSPRTVTEKLRMRTDQRFTIYLPFVYVAFKSIC